MLPLNLSGALARTGTDPFSLITTNMMPSTLLSFSVASFQSVEDLGRCAMSFRACRHMREAEKNDSLLFGK